MALILNSAGKPEPSPEISRRLRYIHPGLHLRYIEALGSIWAVCMEWNENDARFEKVQRGELGAGATFDIIGYLPLHCSQDEAPAYLERVFREYPGNEAINFLDRLDEYNRGPAQEAAEQALAEVLDMKDPSSTKAAAIVSAPPRAPRKRTSKYLS